MSQEFPVTTSAEHRHTSDGGASTGRSALCDKNVENGVERRLVMVEHRYCRPDGCLQNFEAETWKKCVVPGVIVKRQQ